MKYNDGTDMKIGDIVKDDISGNGVLVFSVDNNEYSSAYPKEEWSYLDKGVMINFDSHGDIYYEGPKPYETLIFIRRMNNRERNAITNQKGV